MIRNLINGKYYIGSAKNLERRQKDHYRMLRGKYHHNRHLQSAYERYGEEAFKFVVLNFVEVENLIKVEQEYMDSFFAADQRFGYNLRQVAHSNLGYKFSEETREKNRVAHLGKRHSESTRMKQSEVSKGKKKSAAHAAAISAGKTGKCRPDVSNWAPDRFSKFSPDQVLQMRAEKKGGSTYRAIADKYQCSIATAHFAVNGTGIYYSGI